MQNPMETVGHRHEVGLGTDARRRRRGDPVRAEHVNELIDACAERGIGSLPTKVSAGEPIRASTLYDIQDRIAASATQFFFVDDATQQIWR